MAPTTFEKKWPSVILSPITVANHVITVSSVAGLHPKQVITLSLAGAQDDFEIKRIISPTQLQVGTVGSPTVAAVYANPVAYNGGTLTYSENNRNPMGWDAVGRAVYEEEPAVALRSVLVNQFGEFWNKQNPLPVEVDGITVLPIEVQLTHKDNYTPLPGEHDSLRIGDGTTEALIDLDGALNVSVKNKLGRKRFDKIHMEYDPMTQDLTQVVFSFGGTPIETWDLTYDAFGNCTDVEE